MNLGLQLPDDVVDAIARRAAQLVLEQLDERGAGGAPEWLTIEEAAARLRCAKQRIYEMRASGRLRAYREGGRALVRRDELDALVVADQVLPSLRRAS